MARTPTHRSPPSSRSRPSSSSPSRATQFAEAARSLGIAENLLRNWKQALDAQGDQAFPGQGNLPALEEELRRLRAENKRLQMERDILKKATAFFAKEAL